LTNLISDAANSNHLLFKHYATSLIPILSHHLIVSLVVDQAEMF